MKLSAGEGLAAAGLLIAGVTMLDQTGPGLGKALGSSPDDAGVRAHLTGAELATALTIFGASVVASVLIGARWPMAVAAVAIVLAVAVHEGALRIDTDS